MYKVKSKQTLKKSLICKFQRAEKKGELSLPRGIIDLSDKATRYKMCFLFNQSAQLYLPSARIMLISHFKAGMGLCSKKNSSASVGYLDQTS